MTERERAARLVAMRGIKMASAQGARTPGGGRLPESARRSAQAGVRAALRRLRA